MSQWLRGTMGSRDAGALQDVPWDRAVLAGPHPPNLDTPLLVAPEGPVWTLRFLLARVDHRLLGAGRWVRVDEGGVVHLDEPLRLAVVNGSWGWQCELPGPRKGWGEVPPPEMGLKMFELAQTNMFDPERKKGGATQWRFVPHCWQGLGLGGVDWVGKAWVWTYGNVPGVGDTRYVPWAQGGNGGTVSQVTVLGDWDEELDPGEWWVVS